MKLGQMLPCMTTKCHCTSAHSTESWLFHVSFIIALNWLFIHWLLQQVHQFNVVINLALSKVLNMSKYKNMHVSGAFWITELGTRQREKSESYVWHLMAILKCLIINGKVIKVGKNTPTKVVQAITIMSWKWKNTSSLWRRDIRLSK